MRTPVRKSNDGYYYFQIDLNNAKSGFEDCLETSTFNRLHDRGQIFAEYAHPKLDDHVDPRVKLARVRELHHTRFAGQIKIKELTRDNILCEFVPHGPFKQAAIELDMCKQLWVAPRLLLDTDGNVMDIITYDVVA